MQYDIAAKVLIEKCREEILRRFLGLSVTESTILESAPQETVSVKRSDFPILVTDETIHFIWFVIQKASATAGFKKERYYD